MINIVICGGHLAPALAVMEKLQKSKLYQIFYFGRKNALEGDKAKSLEYDAVKKLNIPFYSITTGRLQRTVTWYTFFSLMKIPLGIIQSFFLLLIIKPKIVVSFGGYLALPVCLCAWILQIPVITHEQTHFLGFSNRIISKIAQILCLSFKDTKNIPKGVKAVITGNPIRESIFTSYSSQIIHFGTSELPLIYVTGGNLGSRTINETIGKALPELISNYRLLHQCGNADNDKDFKYLSQLKISLPIPSRENYRIVKQLSPSSIGTILKSAALIVGRAGANTVSEILTFGVPAILIPLPWSGQSEQEKNALTVKLAGLGEIIMQPSLTPQLLVDTINTMVGKLLSYKANAKTAKISVKLDGDREIEKLIEKYCGLLR